ncbi:MAG: hypothetical protein II728_04005, partial [Bacteroidaceae bacterium]|nr:hypothetical protein [Bacteroidaceae bacterium]
IEKVKAWIANPTEADVLDLESIKLARDNGIDVYEIWNDDDSKLIGYGVDDDTFTLPEQDIKPIPAKEPEKTAKQKPAKESVSYDELMGGEVEWSRIDKYDPEYARFIADVFGENKNGEVTKVDMNHSPRQYKQALAKLEAQKTGETTVATTTAKTAENLAKQLADGLIENSQTASIVLTILDDDSDISTLYDDKIADAFAKSPTGLVKQAFLQGLADRGIAAPGQNGINLLDYYDQLSPTAKEKVKSYVAGQLENYRTNLWAERKASKKKGLDLDETDIVSLTGEEGENNATTLGRREGRNLGRIHSGEYETAREWFIRRAEERGGTRQSGEANARAWQENTREYTDNGAKVIGEQDVDDNHYAIAEALTANDALPCVTYIDVSGMKNPPKMRGFVDAAHPETGLYMFINNPVAVGNKVTEGIGVKHEPFHYFVTQYRAEHNGENPDFDSIIREIAKRSLPSGTKTQARGLAVKLIENESRFSCRAIFDRISGETGFVPTNDQIKQF